MINILLVEDHVALREPLAFMLGREPDIVIAGQAGTLRDARTMLRGVDIGLFDLTLPDGSGLDLISDLQVESPGSSALILTASRNRGDLARAMEAGAAGLLNKTASVEEIVTAIRRVQTGQSLIEPVEMIELLRLAGKQRIEEHRSSLAAMRLTPREIDVLQQLAKGLSDQGIAEQLGVSPETVRTHMVSILGKLEVNSRLQALLFAMRFGIISVE